MDLPELFGILLYDYVGGPRSEHHRARPGRKKRDRRLGPQTTRRWLAEVQSSRTLGLPVLDAHGPNALLRGHGSDGPSDPPSRDPTYALLTLVHGRPLYPHLVGCPGGLIQAGAEALAASMSTNRGAVAGLEALFLELFAWLERRVRKSRSTPRRRPRSGSAPCLSQRIDPGGFFKKLRPGTISPRNGNGDGITRQGSTSERRYSRLYTRTVAYLRAFPSGRRHRLSMESARRRIAGRPAWRRGASDRAASPICQQRLNRQTVDGAKQLRDHPAFFPRLMTFCRTAFASGQALPRRGRGLISFVAELKIRRASSSSDVTRGFAVFFDWDSLPPPAAGSAFCGDQRG